MIGSIVKILLSFPKLADLFLKVQAEYVKKTKIERHRSSAALIDEWVRGSAETNEDTGVRREAPKPQLFRE